MKHQRIITNAEKGAIIEEYLTGEKSSYELAKNITFHNLVLFDGLRLIKQQI